MGNREILLKFISNQGYKQNSPDVNNPFNIIPSNKITMKEDDGSPLKKGPIMGIDNYGNKKIMLPGNDYQFPGDYVVERPFNTYGFFEGVSDEGNLSGGFGVSNDKFGASVFGMTPYSKEDRKYFKGIIEPTLTYRPNQNLDINFSTEFEQNKTTPKVGLKYRFQPGGYYSHRDSIGHQADKILQYEQLQGGSGGSSLPYYSNPKYKDMIMNQILPEVNKIMPNASAIEKGEAIDFIFNAGWDKSAHKISRDPRAYALQEYYRKYDPSKLDKDGKWSGRKGAPYSFDTEYANTIGKLPENERRILMNKGRDWYYQNTAPLGSTWDLKTQGPYPDYYDTWYGRIWNTNDFSEFNPNNPKLKHPSVRKQTGGPTDKIPFEEWYKTVPEDKNDTTQYNLRRAYELAPQEDLDAFVNTDAHLRTAYMQPNGIYEFVKTKDHPTVQKEIDWFNSPDAAEFREEYELDDSGEYYRYLPKKQHGGLDDWFKEKWVDVKTGKQCGRQKGEKRKGYPACRPSKRVNKDTPKTTGEMSSSEKSKFKREKTSSKRIGYQHKRKEDGGILPEYQFAGLTPFTGSDLEYERQYVKDNFGNPNKEVADKVLSYMKLIKEADAKQKASDVQRNEEAYLGQYIPASESTRVETGIIEPLSPQEKIAADQYAQAKKKEQEEFEKRQWEKYEDASIGDKILDRVQAFAVDPYGMTTRFVTGDQAYFPGMGRGLLNSDSPEYENYLKSVGYTPGEIEAVDIGHMFNPMYWGASIGNNISKGNYGTAALESALTFAPFIPKGTGRTLTNNVRQVANTALKPIDKFNPALRTITKSSSLNEALNTIYGIPTSKSLARLNPAELKSYRRVQEIGRMSDLNKPFSEQVQYGLKHLNEDDFFKVFNRPKSQASDELAGMIERESRISNLSAFDLTREPRTRTRTVRNVLTESEADRIANSPGGDFDVENIVSDAVNVTRPNRVQYVDNLLEETRNLQNSLEEWRAANPVRTSTPYNAGSILSSYPTYEGSIRETVPNLHLSSTESLKGVSKKIDDALNTKSLTSGEVFTGSMNTSHNSYLPQMKEVFKYASNDGGSPVFLGFKPMNELGYLSRYKFSSDDIAKYMNSELDLQIKRGVIPKDILRPYVNQKGKIMLPQYGINKYQNGGATHTYKGVNYRLQDGEWFKFIDGQFMPLTEGNIQERYNVLNKYAKKLETGKPYLNDFLYTEDDLKYLNSYEGRDLCPSTGRCLETAFMGYDAMVASRHSDFPSSDKLKESLGFASANSEDYWYSKDNKTLVDRKTNLYVPDQTMKWFQSKPFFDLDNNDFTVDSWDVHGQIVSQGGINLYTDLNSGGYIENSDFAKMSKEEKAKLYAKIPVGAVIGFGDGSRGRGLNSKYNLADSNHSAMVVGHTEEGVPVIYDFGVYTTIEDPKYSFPVTNISFPKEFEKKTKAGLEVLSKFSEPPTELNLNYEVFDKYGADMSELDTFYNTLKKDKVNLMNDLNITNSEYDMLAKLLLATAMQETTGGSTFEHNTFGSTFGETHGLTQMNINNILEDEQLAPIAAKYGITEASDLMDNQKAAYANMIYAKRNLSAARANYQKGLFKEGQTGIRTYNPRSDFDDRMRAKVMNSNPVYDGYTYNTEEGPQVDFFTGVNYLGTGWDKSLEDIQFQFDQISKGRYKVYEDKEGNKIVDKITYGNDPNLSDEEKFIYNWQSPTSLSTGDAQGGSKYMQQVYDFYSKIKREGGEIKIKPENKGKFTAWAEARNLTVKEAEDKVLANKEQYSPSIVKMANFSRNARGWKKEQGGSIIGEKTLDLNNLDSKYKKGGYTYKATNDIIEAKNLLSLLI